jgi:hypothetical protein
MNKTTLCASVLAAAALLSGCGLPQAVEADGINKTDPLTCASAAECDRYLARLAVWVERNTAHKIKVHTDTVLQQWLPYESMHGFVFASREAATGGGGLITVRVGCMHILGCYPGAGEMLRSVHAYVRGSD